MEPFIIVVRSVVKSQSSSDLCACTTQQLAGLEGATSPIYIVCVTVIFCYFFIYYCELKLILWEVLADPPPIGKISQLLQAVKIILPILVG